MAQPTDRPRFVESRRRLVLEASPLLPGCPPWIRRASTCRSCPTAMLRRMHRSHRVSRWRMPPTTALPRLRKHPQRFGGFCTLPWQDTDAAVRESEAVCSSWTFAQPCSSVAPVRVSFSKTNGLIPTCKSGGTGCAALHSSWRTFTAMQRSSSACSTAYETAINRSIIPHGSTKVVPSKRRQPLDSILSLSATRSVDGT